ncbi:MAG TPA: tetratricopeptide repeat protein [Gemmatimonadaceae bacterium]|nr:tetratricopeptide repeat protein [Gemmatimonadaceae bacterium]
MAISARIEELERKFNENPRRYFAPLANEYRKAGDLTQAISICRTYVPQQPAHMSGHIVFGQALFEAGEFEEARGVFESALQLDPENLIALRHLGDIARERGDLTAARTWYRRVLDADPRNPEVVSLLSSIDGLPDAQPHRQSSPVEALSGWQDINPERTLELPPTLATPTPPAVPETITSAPTPVLTPRIERPSAPIDGFFSAESDLEEMKAAPPPSAEEGGMGSGFESMEFQAPTRPDRPSPPPIESLPESDTPQAFVTETMAELYLQQGFRDEALGVYRQLLAQNPGDDNLRERVAQLESGSRSSMSVAAVSDSVIDAARERHGAPAMRSVRAFFGGLAARRVVMHASGHVTGEHAVAEHVDSEHVDSEHVDSEHVGSEHVDSEHVGSEHDAPERMAPEYETIERRTAEITTVERTTAYVPPAPVDVQHAAVEPQSHPEADPPAAMMQADPAPSHEPPSHEPPADPEPVHETPRAEDHAEPEADHRDVAGYSDEAFSDDAFGANAFTGGYSPRASGGILAKEDFGSEGLVSRVTEEVDVFGLPLRTEQSEPEPEPPRAEAAPEHEPTPIAAPAAPRNSGQTDASVNGLFAGSNVAATDDAAASTLAGAFGGAQPEAPAPTQERAVRPAKNELSLDTVFRESPSGDGSPTRRESSAFSFDQFFGNDTNTDNVSPIEGAVENHDESTGAETEQFSSWLSGLKKK